MPVCFEEVRKIKRKNEAKEIVSQIKQKANNQAGFNFVSLFTSLLKILEENNLTLDEISVAETELDALWARCCKKEALTQIKAIRSAKHNTVNIGHHLKRLKELMVMGRFSYSEIGTNEEELCEARVKWVRSVKSSIEHTLKKIISGDRMYAHTSTIKQLREKIDSIGAKPEEFGTSDEELMKLSKKLRNEARSSKSTKPSPTYFISC